MTDAATLLALAGRVEKLDQAVNCALENQIEIMGAVSLLLRYARPNLIGGGGELDSQRNDLLQRHKATQATFRARAAQASSVAAGERE